MRAGNLKDRITLQVSQKSVGKYGEQEPQWVDVVKMWAHVIPLSGSESFEGHTVKNEQSYKVRFRPRNDVSPSNRFLWNGRVLEILTPPVDPYGRNDEYNVMCKEVVNA